MVVVCVVMGSSGRQTGAGGGGPGVGQPPFVLLAALTLAWDRGTMWLPAGLRANGGAVRGSAAARWSAPLCFGVEGSQILFRTRPVACPVIGWAD